MSGVSLGERSFGWSWILRLHVSIKISVCMVTSVLRRWFKPFVLSLTWTCAKESHEILETAGFLFLSGRGAFLESGWLIQFHFGVLRLDIYTFALSRVVFSLLWCWFADRGGIWKTPTEDITTLSSMSTMLNYVFCRELCVSNSLGFIFSIGYYWCLWNDFATRPARDTGKMGRADVIIICVCFGLLLNVMIFWAVEWRTS